jgi:hypothetical protein
VAAVGFNAFLTAFRRVRSWMRPIEIASGLVLVAVGVLIFTNYFAVLASYLNRWLLPAGRSARMARAPPNRGSPAGSKRPAGNGSRWMEKPGDPPYSILHPVTTLVVDGGALLNRPSASSRHRQTPPLRLCRLLFRLRFALDTPTQGKLTATGTLLLVFVPLPSSPDAFLPQQ